MKSRKAPSAVTTDNHSVVIGRPNDARDSVTEREGGLPPSTPCPIKQLRQLQKDSGALELLLRGESRLQIAVQHCDCYTDHTDPHP